MQENIGKPNLLIVDDNEKNLYSFKRTLRELDINIDTVLSGEEALHSIINKEYFMILLDVQMPGMDGYETAKIIKSDKAFIDTAIVFITAINKNDDNVDKGYDSGGVDYLFKPISPNLLINKVSVFLKLYLQKKELLEKSNELLKTNEHLSIAKSKAEAANIAKTEFLANITHELRTPLNAIIGFSDVLMKMELEKNIKEPIWFIENAGHNLLKLINDILDYSKVSSNGLILEHTPFEIRPELLPIIHPHKLESEKTGVQINLEIKDNVPEILQGDFHRIKQILNNLLSNAVKFTHEGQIKLLVENLGNENNISHIKISISDSGIGIPKDKQDELFSSFTQVDASITRKYGGTGLGLPICKKLVKLFNGEIGVSSEESKGSLFWFTLKLEKIDLDSIFNE